MSTLNLEERKWWSYLEADLQELILQSLDLLRVTNSLEAYRDYSFVVFPIGKAYEGFLKKFFYDVGFISSNDYYGTRFRIGKALNPSIEASEGDDWWVYKKLTKFCGGKSLPDRLWNAWKACRNEVFHWFPGQSRNMTRSEAQDCVNQIVAAIDSVFEECKIPGV